MGRLLGVHVQARLGSLVNSDPDAFRQRYCYTEATCHVLKRHEKALTMCFEYVLNTPESLEGAEPEDTKTETVAFQLKEKSVAASVKEKLGFDTFSLRQWLRALKILKIVDLDMSERDALRCFSWSRMAVANARVRGSVWTFEPNPSHQFRRRDHLWRPEGTR